MNEEKKNEEPLEPPHSEEAYDSEHLDVVNVDESVADYEAEETNAKEKPNG